MIKVLIVDDHSIVREGLSKIIQLESDIEIAGVAKNAAEALKFISSNKVDIIILDISMPGMSGLDVIKDLKKLQPKVKILMLSMYPEERFAMRALRSGAYGYLTKEMAPEEIIKAIRIVFIGHKYISPTLAERIITEIQNPKEIAPHERLSTREFEVMCMIGSAKTINEIATSLSISNRTISTYRTRILQKMNFKNNAAIMHYVIDNGLVR